MVPIEPRGVSCEIFVESGAEWVDPDAVAVDEIYGPVLRNSPRFARRVDGEALEKILANAEKGVWRVSCGLADAFILCRDYGVPVPSQLGVINMQDEVKIWIALRARVQAGERR